MYIINIIVLKRRGLDSDRESESPTGQWYLNYFLNFIFN